MPRRIFWFLWDPFNVFDCFSISRVPSNWDWNSNWWGPAQWVKNNFDTFCFEYIQFLLTFPKVMSLLRFCLFFLVKVGDTCLFRHGWSSPPSGSLLGQPQLCVLYISPVHLLSIYVWILSSVFLQIMSHEGSCFTLALVFLECRWLTPLLTSGATRFARGH